MSQTQEQTAGNQGDDRVARFRADVADMHLRDPQRRSRAAVDVRRRRD